MKLLRLMSCLFVLDYFEIFTTKTILLRHVPQLMAIFNTSKRSHASLHPGKAGSCKACRTREQYAELTVTRAYWRKQVLPVCGEILRVFHHACQKSLKILPHTGGFCLRQWSRVNFCSADSSRVRQA